MVRQFAYIHGVAGISLLSGKNIKCDYNIFFLSQETRQQQTLISNLRFLHPMHKIHNGLQNMQKFFYFSRALWLGPVGSSLYSMD